MNGVRLGQGKMVWKDGSTYEGEYRDEFRNGFGKYTLENKSEGVYYVCEWKDDKSSGEGTQVWKNGEKNVGQFENNKRQGYGVLNLVTGDVYSGNWKSNQKDGFGQIAYSKNDVRQSFEGNFKNDVKNGNGSLTTKNGLSTYEGGFQNDTYSGFGILRNGFIYEGTNF